MQFFAVVNLGENFNDFLKLFVLLYIKLSSFSICFRLRFQGSRLSPWLKLGIR